MKKKTVYSNEFIEATKGKRYLTVPEACAATTLGRDTLVRFAKRCGVLLKINDRRVVDSEVLYSAMSECKVED
ncbi:MAG: hypothetical protein LUE16_04620 [Lachnospiraceae bacterium]|nr:hypothetical protein [Lachnospiraceae bacterium]